MLYLELSLDDVALFRDVDTVEELANILVLDGHRVPDGGGRLRHALHVVARQNELVLLGFRQFDGDAGQHGDAAGVLVAEEVSDFNVVAGVADVCVYGEMGVDKAHLVLKAAGDANNHVVDVRAHGADAGHVLAGAVPHAHHEGGLGGDQLHGDMGEVLVEGAAWSYDGDFARDDGDLHVCRDCDRLLLADVAH